jgi:hypothetical protein
MVERLTINEASDGVKIWDVQTHAELVLPTQSQGVLGPATRMMWIQQRDPSKEILCYGTALGYLGLWRHAEQQRFEALSTRRIATGTEIMALAFDASSVDSIRIALGTRDRVVQVHRLDRGQLLTVFSIQLNGTVPGDIAFVDNTRDLHVFGTYDGLMCELSYFVPYILTVFASHILKADDGKIITTHDTGKPM